MSDPTGGILIAIKDKLDHHYHHHLLLWLLIPLLLLPFIEVLLCTEVVLSSFHVLFFFFSHFICPVAQCCSYRYGTRDVTIDWQIYPQIGQELPRIVRKKVVVWAGKYWGAAMQKGRRERDLFLFPGLTGIPIPVSKWDLQRKLRKLTLERLMCTKSSPLTV